MSPDDTPADGNRPSASVTPAPDAPVALNQSIPEMLQAIMARFIQQEETNKATSDRLAALAAALGTLDGENDRAETARRRHLYEAWLASTSDDRTEVEPPKPKTTKNSKIWSKSKDKKKKSNEKREEDSPPTDDGDQSHHDEESPSDEEKPKSRRKIFTIRTTPSATANSEDDLRQSLNQKIGKTIESFTPTDISVRRIGSSGTLMKIDGAPPRISHSIRKLNVSDARHVIDAKRKDPLHRQDELEWEQLSNSQPDYIEATYLRIKLNSKIPDLREKLKRCKTDRSKTVPEPITPYQRKTQDLRITLGSRAVGEIPSSSKPKTAKPN
ncbi:hypothetical protein F2Q69_00024068 [Brassica cretica]|uniref:Uncharacterized protein n=1 Tax=Brassica cretica TaxID=69181 RepID=A0A8S9Q572_BRACR|nr:hypothetical protein F2Q69_00024068 [Brassica cretica]